MIVMKTKKSKAQKVCVKLKIKVKIYEKSYEAIQLEDKMKHSEKNNVNVNNLRENHKEFMKNNN